MIHASALIVAFGALLKKTRGLRKGVVRVRDDFCLHAIRYFNVFILDIYMKIRYFDVFILDIYMRTMKDYYENVYILNRNEILYFYI